MKFFHLSDLHIGLRLCGRDLNEDQEYILDQIVRRAKEEVPDAVVISGDIYDKALPSQEAVSLFDRFVRELTEAVPECEIMMISGNHDSGARINLYRSVLERHKVHMIGLPPREEGEKIEKVVLEDEFGPVCFYLLPFVRPSMVRQVLGKDQDEPLGYDEALHALIGAESIDEDKRNVLVSHQFYLPAGTDPDRVERMESEIVTVGNIDAVTADVLERFDYAALGHIHKPMKVGKEQYRYCGTPLKCSFSEEGQEKGIVVVDMKEKGNTKISVHPLKPLREVRTIEGSLEKVLEAPSQDYVRVVLTDKADLDVIDMQERLRRAFPGLLEVRRSVPGNRALGAEAGPEEIPDPMTLCGRFLGEMTPEETALLQEVIIAAGEVRE